MDDETLLHVAGGGTPEQHLSRYRLAEPDDEFPAANGFTLQQRELDFFLMDANGYPAVHLNHWGHGNGKEIGPVASLIVAEKYRGKGLGKMLYRALLNAGFIISSGENHTQHSIKLYQWLAAQPDIEIVARDEKNKLHPVELKNGKLVSDIPIYGPEEWTTVLVVRKR